MFVWFCMRILVRWCWLWKQMKAEKFTWKKQVSGEKQFQRKHKNMSYHSVVSISNDAIVSPVISTVNVCGRCNKKSTAMKDSWRLVVVDGPLIVSAECHKNWYRTFQGILKIWVCRKWEFQSRPATAIDHQCSCLTTFPLPICTHKLLLAQSKGTATWDSGPLG